MNLQFSAFRCDLGSQGKNYSRSAKILDSICLNSFCGQETREIRNLCPHRSSVRLAIVPSLRTSELPSHLIRRATLALVLLPGIMRAQEPSQFPKSRPMKMESDKY